MKSGSGARGGDSSLSLFFLALLLLLAVLFRSDVARREPCAGVLALAGAGARARERTPLMTPLRLSFTLLFECQTRFLPLPSAISVIDRPVVTESGFSSR